MRNEEETLPTLIDRIDKTLDPIHSIEKEIIIINDNSNDNTFSICEKYCLNNN